jgi:hypothetical protein
MMDLTQERDVDTLRQISLLLERENQRLITKTLELTAENARLRGLADPEQLALAELHALEQRRAQVLAPTAARPLPRGRRVHHGRGTGHGRSRRCRLSSCATSCRRIDVRVRRAEVR